MMMGERYSAVLGIISTPLYLFEPTSYILLGSSASIKVLLNAYLETSVVSWLEIGSFDSPVVHYASKLK